MPLNKEKKELLSAESKRYRQIRRRFREMLPGPNKVRLLLIGESPPAGPNFFYHHKGRVYTSIEEAMIRVHGLPDTMERSDVLREFTSNGYFLEDLTNTPIDDRSSAARKSKRDMSITRLAIVLRRIDPVSLKGIICFVPEVAPHIQDARDRAGLSNIPSWVLPFPGGRHSPFTDKLCWIMEYIKAK